MSRFAKTLATFALVPAIAAMTTASYAAFNDGQKKEIEGIIGSYLQSNPQVIITALQEMQRKQMEEAQKTIQNTQKDAAKFAQALFHASGDPIAGNPNGTVTITEFYDYQCGHCIEMGSVINQLVSSDPNVRIVFKEFPIRGPVSEFASRASLAANMQGKFKEFHETLMKAPQPLTNDIVLSTAKQVGLDMTKLNKDMNSSAVSNQIQATMKLAQDLKLMGTPAFFIGKTNTTPTSSLEYVPGSLPLDQLQMVVKKVS